MHGFLVVFASCPWAVSPLVSKLLELLIVPVAELLLSAAATGSVAAKVVVVDLLAVVVLVDGIG